MSRSALLVVLLFATLIQARAQDANPVIVLQTTKGVIEIELFADEAPLTVANFLSYVDEGFYDDTIFHRVIPKFVVQGGGFTPEFDLKPTRDAIRIETKNKLKNERGSVSMARNAGRDSATSQFFINLTDNDQLDRQVRSFGYTVFGRVLSGIEVVDRIAGVQTSNRGPFRDVPILPVILETARRK